MYWDCCWYDDVKVYVLVYDGGFDFLYIGLFIWDVIIYLVILLRNNYFQQLDSSLNIAFLKKLPNSCDLSFLNATLNECFFTTNLNSKGCANYPQKAVQERREDKARIAKINVFGFLQ